MTNIEVVMMKKKFKLSLITLIIAFLSATTAIGESFPKFRIMTEPWIPYQFEENGEIKGVSVDLLVLMLKRIGSKQTRKDIKMYPWARGYHYTQTIQNTILFSTTRTTEREDIFKWVGPIFQNTILLIAKKDRHIKINSPEELKDYSIGTVIYDVGEQYMVKLGFTLEQLSRNTAYVNSIRMLEGNRIDMVVMSWGSFSSFAESCEINPNLFEGVFVVKSDDIYYAFHKDTPDWIIKKFQNAFNELKTDGKLDELMKKYKSNTK